MTRLQLHSAVLVLIVGCALPLHSTLAQRACSITFDPIVATAGAGSTAPTQITIAGTTGGMNCTEVQATIGCVSTTTKLATPDATTGRWSIVLSATEAQALGCSCSLGRIGVSAVCMKGPTVYCSPPNTMSQNITCQNCPTVQNIAWSPLSCSSRDAQGGWPVTFQANVSGNFSGRYRWNFGEAGSATNIAIEAIAPMAPAPPSAQSHTYSCPGTNTYHVELIGEGCPAGDPYYESSLTRDLTFQACGTCPQIQPISVSTSTCSATLSTSVATCASGVTGYFWNFGHPQPGSPTPQTSATVSTSTPTATHTYPYDGTYTTTVTLGGVEGGQCSRSVPVTITGCGAHPGDGPGTGGGHHDGPKHDDGGSLCGIFDWCCWLLGAFVILYIGFWVMWHYNVLPYAWYVGIAALLAGLLWIAICQPTF
jgi:hypothetical protein